MQFFTSVALIYLFLVQTEGQECSGVSFAKAAGYAPRVDSPQPVLYSAASGNAITAECYNRCKKAADCAGFILEYAKTKCYQVNRNSYYRARQELVPDPSVSFFSKLCINVPSNCSRAWVVDLVPGYELAGLQHSVLSNIDDRWTCASRCVGGNGTEPCYSANYNARERTCALSSRNLNTDRDAFIPTTKADTDYLENHCIQEEGPKCWRDPVVNVSSLRMDTVFTRLTEDECRDRCQASSYYPCSAYSYIASEGKCLLHSDAALLPAGPLLTPPLAPTRGAFYVERIPCVNLSVTCDENVLRVTLFSPKFAGRLYVEGHSERCGVDGQRRDVTILNIPAGDSAGDACGVRVARGLARRFNRTQYTAVVIVQHHPLIQTVGDRVVRVQCFLGDAGSTAAPPTDNGTSNVTVGTQVIVATPPTQNEVTGYGNGGETTPGGGGVGAPRAEMYIVDATGRPVTRIDIGDPLQLRIIIQPPFNVSMVRAGHLVASSGDSGGSSLLLLDWRGCPPDITVFPNLLPTDAQTLVADFKAFKFPNSPVLMLSVVLTFCPDNCKPTDCGNGVESYGRRKRSADGQRTTPMTPNSETTEGIRGYEEMSLQVALVVSGSAPTNHGIIESAPLSPPLATDDTSLICVSFLTLALLAILWLLVQCVIMALFCWYLGKREKEHADTISLRRDFQPPTHHVTWADQQQPFRVSSTVI